MNTWSVCEFILGLTTGFPQILEVTEMSVNFKMVRENQKNGTKSWKRKILIFCQKVIFCCFLHIPVAIETANIDRVIAELKKFMMND